MDITVFGIIVDISQFLLLFVILPIIIIKLYDFMLFKRLFTNLCDEIEDNFTKFKESHLEIEFEEMRRKLEQRIVNNKTWVGLNKEIVIWIMVLKTDIKDTDYYRYLPSNEFRNFIQRGYYHYVKGIKGSLTLFYIYCDQISIKTQRIEANDINYNPEFLASSTDEKKEKLEYIINIFRESFNNNRPEIEERYRDIHPVFKKNLFHIIKLYVFEGLTMKEAIKGWGRYLKYLVILVWGVLAFAIGYNILTNPTITYCNSFTLIEDLSITCITISSITIAALFAYFAIVAIKMDVEQIKKIPIGITIIPTLAVFFGLFSLYFSFFEYTFPYAKVLFAVTMEITIFNFLVLYLLADDQKYHEFLTKSN